jgi:lipooligosaccharide transport system permease protein
MNKIKPPSIFKRIFSVWYRHYRVYVQNIISNGFPIFMEPLFFLFAFGIGMTKYITDMGGVSYLTFLASGLLITPAMYTASYECTFGTFIRLEYEKVYDGMLASPLSYKDLVIGEILFSGTKGLFFSFCIMLVIVPFGLISIPWALIAPLCGLFTGLMFASVSLIITAFVTNINHFNFYFTGFLTPMFFFSGTVFPIENIPLNFRWIAELFPLTHTVRIARAFCIESFNINLIFDLIYTIIFIIITGLLAVILLRRRLID